MLVKLIKAAAIIFVFLGTSNSVIAEDLLENADLAYGEYLAGECVTCQVQVAQTGIPSIIGLDAEGFAYMMHSYRNKELDNKVMQLVAGRLDDEQTSGLFCCLAGQIIGE